jgi:hypothetical protein
VVDLALPLQDVEAGQDLSARAVVCPSVSPCQQVNLHRESYMKSPSIEVSARVVSAIITLALGEWWHWVPVIAAIVVVRVLRRT